MMVFFCCTFAPPWQCSLNTLSSKKKCPVFERGQCTPRPSSLWSDTSVILGALSLFFALRNKAAVDHQEPYCCAQLTVILCRYYCCIESMLCWWKVVENKLWKWENALLCLCDREGEINLRKRWRKKIIKKMEIGKREKYQSDISRG